MSLFADTLRANRTAIANLLAWRASVPAQALVTVRDVDGVWRVCNRVDGGAWCRKMVDGAECGGARWFAFARMSPA